MAYQKTILSKFPINKGKGKNKSYNTTFNRRREALERMRPHPPSNNGWWYYEYFRDTLVGKPKQPKVRR